MVICVSIPNWHPARLNQLLGHWEKAMRLKRSDAEMVAAYFLGQPKATEKRLVHLTIHLAKGQRAGDPDSYFKTLLDALVRCGQLKDDSRQWCELGPVEFVRTGVRGATITLEEI